MDPATIVVLLSTSLIAVSAPLTGHFLSRRTSREAAKHARSSDIRSELRTIRDELGSPDQSVALYAEHELRLLAARVDGKAYGQEDRDAVWAVMDWAVMVKRIEHHSENRQPEVQARRELQEGP